MEDKKPFWRAESPSFSLSGGCKSGMGSGANVTGCNGRGGCHLLPPTFQPTPASSIPGLLLAHAHSLHPPSLWFLHLCLCRDPRLSREITASMPSCLSVCIPQSHPTPQACCNIKHATAWNTPFSVGGPFPLRHIVFPAKRGLCGRA